MTINRRQINKTAATTAIAAIGNFPQLANANPKYGHNLLLIANGVQTDNTNTKMPSIITDLDNIPPKTIHLK